MIKIKNIEEDTQQVLNFLQELKIKQQLTSNKERTAYPKIALHTALKYKVFFSNLLLHSKVLTEKFFYEEKKQIEDVTLLKDKLGEVLEFEMISGKETLTLEERTKIIKLFSTLKKKVEKEVINI